MEKKSGTVLFRLFDFYQEFLYQNGAEGGQAANGDPLLGVSLCAPSSMLHRTPDVMDILHYKYIITKNGGSQNHTTTITKSNRFKINSN